MSRHQTLETERLRLRPMEESDLTRLVEFMGERGVTEFLILFSYPICPEQVRHWLEGVLAADLQGCAYWAITDRATNRLIGVISLTVDNYHKKGEIGFWLDKFCWKQGYMTEAAWRVIRYAFDELKLHRVEITHMVENKASRRVVEKLGFQPEGCWREGHYKEGRFRDVCIYGMLEVDYLRSQKRFAEVGKS